MKISVYITSYNKIQYLSEAVDSVLGQTIKPYEIIIVDDASTDGSQELIRAYANQYPELIRAIFHSRNVGISASRNDAIKAVHGDYFSYLDGDDRFLPTKIEDESTALAQFPDSDFFFANFWFTNDLGARYRIWAEKGESIPEGDIFCQTYAFNFPGNVHFRNELIKTRAIDKTGLYDPGLKIYEDYDFRIRLAKYYRGKYIHQELSEYRKYGSGLSDLNSRDNLASISQIARRNEGLLGDLTPAARRKTLKLLNEFLAAILRREAIHSIFGGKHNLSGRRNAIKLYIKSLKFNVYFDPKLCAAILLPGYIYSRLPHLNKSIKRNSQY